MAEVMRFRSAVDGSEQHAGICGPAKPPAGELLPLIVELEPGSIVDLDANLADGNAHLALLGEPAVWLRPGGRGPGTVFQGYGAVDVFEAIEAARDRFPIDPDRISLYGFSMGGAGVWYLASHYPDRFAAVAPLGGYNDFRLWKRPGGMTFPLQPWEKPSWQARSAIFLLENLRHVGIWIVHGEWDRAVGGGVDVQHARQSASSLDQLGIAHRYTELAATGHDRSFMREAFFGEVLRWLIRQRRQPAPHAFTFRTYDLHHSRAYWVDVRQQQRYGAASRVSVDVSDGQLVIDTENVQHLAIDPSPALQSGDLVIDGQLIADAVSGGTIGLRRGLDGAWRAGDPEPPAGEKRPCLSGPFGGLFERGTVLVRGTTGSREETFYNEWCSRDAAKFFRDTNGGVHRGGIPGASWVDLPIMDDTAWLGAPSMPAHLGRRNAIAYGTTNSNALLASVAGKVGVSVEGKSIHVGDRTFRGDGLAVIAVVPFPDLTGRYLGIHGGTSPDATTSGAHLNLQLLPDYLVYDAARVLEWGFFDNEWRPVPGGDA
jgi:pimeloyl-ACP methyl ester carboxylesterase